MSGRHAVEAILSTSQFENVQYVPGEWYKPESFPCGQVYFFDGLALRRSTCPAERRASGAASVSFLDSSDDAPAESAVIVDESLANSYSETSEASGGRTLPKIPSRRMLTRVFEGVRSVFAPKRLSTLMGVPCQSCHNPECGGSLESPVTRFGQRTKSTPEFVVARRGAVPSFTAMASNGVVPVSVPPPRAHARSVKRHSSSSSLTMTSSSSHKKQLGAGEVSPHRPTIERAMKSPNRLRIPTEAWSHSQIAGRLSAIRNPAPGLRRARSMTVELVASNFSQTSDRKAGTSFLQQRKSHSDRGRLPHFGVTSDCNQKVNEALARMTHGDEPRL